MPEYTDVSGTMQRPAPGTLMTCSECGAVVTDTVLHEAWHELNKIAKPKEAG
jgi:hypothetical protein